MDEFELLEQQAIDAAISHNWEKAVELNRKLLDTDNTKLETFLRLGFAYLQLEDIKNAKKYYQQALKIQPRSPVALENLERISVLEEKGSAKNPIKIKATLNPGLFMETPGKTKTVSLVNLGQKNHLAELDVGEQVELKLKKRKVEVRTLTNDYIGYIPDDLSKRLIYFLEAGSKYSAHVKEAGQNKVVIFIKEESKGHKVTHMMSFPTNMNFNFDQKESDEEGEEAEEAEEADATEWELAAQALDEEAKEFQELAENEEEEEEE